MNTESDNYSLSMRTLTLDWDIDFSTVKASVSYGILRRFIRDNNDVRRVSIRKSSGGNTHVIIEFMVMLTEMEKYQLRCLLRDDLLRIKLDHIRDLIEVGKWKVGNYRVGGAGGTGRLFDWKIKNGDIGEAGEWECIHERRSN